MQTEFGMRKSENLFDHNHPRGDTLGVQKKNRILSGDSDFLQSDDLGGGGEMSPLERRNLDDFFGRWRHRTVLFTQGGQKV